MTQTAMNPALAYLADAPRLPILATAALRVVAFAVKCHERARTRQSLSHLDQYLLDDIGVSPAQARREASKPFWQS
ncbi:DUF1127 domain-containing protein [Thalassococcus lentus]|uniref:DUF1127 domain-containing protein n=1 Tax=Thalassococcus lentus TaxID=1210524 RepID=A0ABT4XRA5_9RHOB|nr:DUF1127 domain-containing protein [Thalassococcus lentus]MDA7424491.1 DUF1127 domain-containing protein [Thalassococcus lentus]